MKIGIVEQYSPNHTIEKMFDGVLITRLKSITFVLRVSVGSNNWY